MAGDKDFLRALGPVLPRAKAERDKQGARTEGGDGDRRAAIIGCGQLAVLGVGLGRLVQVVRTI